MRAVAHPGQISSRGEIWATGTVPYVFFVLIAIFRLLDEYCSKLK